jgi:hypothetical protein
MKSLEFSLLNETDTNLIKIIAHRSDNKMYLELLTKTSSLGLEQSFIAELTTDDLLEIIKTKA